MGLSGKPIVVVLCWHAIFLANLCMHKSQSVTGAADVDCLMHNLRFRTRCDQNASPVLANATIELLHWLVCQRSGGGEYVMFCLCGTMLGTICGM